jgi:REP-associated tyrosine transposase
MPNPCASPAWADAKISGWPPQPSPPQLRLFDTGSLFHHILYRASQSAPSRVIGSEVRLTGDGHHAMAAWRTTFRHFAEVRALSGVIMPDHVHMLLHLRGDVARRKPITEIVGALKTAAAASINRARGTPGSCVWQRSFYDTVVRTRVELEGIHRYIAENPLRWSEEQRTDRGVASSPPGPVAMAELTGSVSDPR